MKITDTLKYGTLVAQHYRYSPGGDPIFLLTSDTLGDDSEIVLDEADAKALHAWLGRALSQGDCQK